MVLPKSRSSDNVGVSLLLAKVNQPKADDPKPEDRLRAIPDTGGRAALLFTHQGDCYEYQRTGVRTLRASARYATEARDAASNTPSSRRDVSAGSFAHARCRTRFCVMHPHCRAPRAPSVELHAVLELPRGALAGHASVTQGRLYQEYPRRGRCGRHVRGRQTFRVPTVSAFPEGIC